MSTVGEVYREGRRALFDAGIDGPDFEAGCLFQKAFGLDRQERILRSAQAADPVKTEQLRGFLRERINGRPLQYILGEWPFCGRNLLVGEGVLIPREETELLVGTAAELLEDSSEPEILDLCSGTGAVALTLAARFPGAKVGAAEWLEPAFHYLNLNLERQGLSNIRAVRLDVLNPASAERFRDLDCIVSNPPYVRAEELPGLQPEVRREPREALDGGEDGLDFYRAIAKIWAPRLRPGGVLCVECGEDQARRVAALFADAGLSEIRFYKDFNNIDRVVSARKAR